VRNVLAAGDDQDTASDAYRRVRGRPASTRGGRRRQIAQLIFERQRHRELETLRAYDRLIRWLRRRR
jgi:hypothetical protein